MDELHTFLVTFQLKQGKIQKTIEAKDIRDAETKSEIMVHENPDFLDVKQIREYGR